MSSNLIEYFQENGTSIYLVTWFLFLLLIIITVYGVQFHKLKYEEEENKKRNEDRSEVTTVLYEGQKNKKKEGFCNESDIDKKCKKLKQGGAAACVTQDCCVWAQSKNKKGQTEGYCMKGDDEGPEDNKDAKGNNFFRYIHQTIKKDGDGSIINWKTYV